MNYYFDESGNWSGRERHRLLIGGLLLKDEQLERKLKREFTVLVAESGITSLHANELTDELREICYQIIDRFLTPDTEVLVHIYRSSILRSKTGKNYDEIYTDCASELINTMTFGDPEIKIFYDLKFHYAYPLNVIRNLTRTRPKYYNKMKKNFNLGDAAFLKNKENILNKLRARVKDKRAPARDKRLFEDFIARINDTNLSFNCLDPQVLKKLDKKRDSVKSNIADYLWSELWLQIEGSEQARENFRTAILAKSRETRNTFAADIELPNVELKFFGKQQNNAGVTVIDFICNLVYRYGLTPPTNVSDAVKSIYSKIALEEIK